MYSRSSTEVAEKLQITDLSSREPTIALCCNSAPHICPRVALLFLYLFVLIQYKRKVSAFGHSVPVSYVKEALCRCFACDWCVRLHQHLCICRSEASVIMCLCIYQLFSVTQGQSACLVVGAGRCVYAWRLCLFVQFLNVLQQLFIALLPLTELLR